MEERMLGEGITRSQLNLVFVIDKSGSMAGQNIAAVNSAIRDVMSIMPDIQEDTSDAEIKLSALTFSDSADWVYSEPKSIEEFKWHDLTTEGGTDLSKAYDELGNWLSKKSNGGQMPDLGGIAPILILMTDGIPTSYDWREKLDKLKKKGWYRAALKYALSIGVDSDEAKDVLVNFTGNPETVLTVYSAEALRKVIKVIAVTASKVKSHSANVSTNANTPANNVAEVEIKKELESVDEVEW